ncbi:hypothetical protein [Burkholderia cenocepacia]|uniref:hypothetical protein n=1 Tax=Burkholderia cenocepacia TaxID=95486 RepID=UPI00158DD871|nr:hypothetical protein [Burkholderia cenocepacia]
MSNTNTQRFSTADYRLNPIRCAFLLRQPAKISTGTYFLKPAVQPTLRVLPGNLVRAPAIGKAGPRKTRFMSRMECLCQDLNVRHGEWPFGITP